MKKIFKLLLIHALSFSMLNLSAFAEDTVTREGYFDDFEGDAVSSRLFEKTQNTSLSSVNPLSGSKSLVLNGAASIKTVDFSPFFSDEAVVISFKLKVNTVPASITPGSDGFLGNDEIFQLRAYETDRIDSGNPYSAKFNIVNGNTGGKIRFTGYDTAGSVLYTDTAVDGQGNVEFPADNTYDVKLTYSKTMFYIDINNGQITTSYTSGRETIRNFAIYTRSGSNVVIDDFSVYGTENEEYPISSKFRKYLNDGLFSGYVFAENNRDGVMFSRMTYTQRARYGVARSYGYQAGVSFDAYTNSRNFIIEYKILDSSFAYGWPTAFDTFVNGVKQTSPAAVSQKKGKNYSYTYTLPESAGTNNRVTIMFPPDVNMAVTDFRLDSGSVAYKVEKDKKIIVFGDSITQGSECFLPGSVYSNQVAMTYGMELLNNAVAGSSFNGATICSGDFGGYDPDYAILSYGTNSFASGAGQLSERLVELEAQVPACIQSINTKFPNANIIAILPIWRSDETEGNFTLSDIRNKISEIYARYPEITVFDGYDYVPHDDIYWSSTSLKLHPSALGHDLYGQNLIADMAESGMAIPSIDWAAKAESIVEKGEMPFKYNVNIYSGSYVPGMESLYLKPGTNIVKYQVLEDSSFPSYTFVSALYKGTYLKDIKILSKAQAVNNETSSFNIPVNDDIKDYTLKTFAFDGLHNIKPITDSVKTFVGKEIIDENIIYFDDFESKTASSYTDLDFTKAIEMLSNGVIFGNPEMAYAFSGTGFDILDNCIDGKSFIFNSLTTALSTDSNQNIIEFSGEKGAVFEADIKPVEADHGLFLVIIRGVDKNGNAQNITACEIGPSDTGASVTSSGVTKNFELGHKFNFKAVIDRNDGSQPTRVKTYIDNVPFNTNITFPDNLCIDKLNYVFIQSWVPSGTYDGQIALDNIKLYTPGEQSLILKGNMNHVNVDMVSGKIKLSFNNILNQDTFAKNNFKVYKDGVEVIDAVLSVEPDSSSMKNCIVTLGTNLLDENSNYVIKTTDTLKDVFGSSVIENSNDSASFTFGSGL